MLQNLFGATQTDKTICDHRKSVQLDLALKLEAYCNIYYKTEGHSLDDVRKIEHSLKIKIIIYDLNRNVLYQQEGELETIIFLMFDESHYNYITRLTDAFKTVNNIKCNLCGMKGIIHTENM